MINQLSQEPAKAQRVVFFDLDGTLHQEEMFGSFLHFLLRHLPLNLVLVVPLLPIVGLGMLIGERAYEPVVVVDDLWPPRNQTASVGVAVCHRFS